MVVMDSKKLSLKKSPQVVSLPTSPKVFWPGREEWLAEFDRQALEALKSGTIQAD